MGRFSFFTDMMAGLFERKPQSTAAPSADNIQSMARALLSGRGEASGMRVSQEILDLYRRLDETERLAFFDWMARDLDVDPKIIIATAETYRDSPGAGSYAALARAAEPPRQELLRRLNQAAGATQGLVRMRLDLLGLLDRYPRLAPLDVDFTHLFRSWFNRGFLVLRPIDWHTPANILEKIIEYEAVHTINDWSDLQRRVMPRDRRCFAFFHPAMLDEPLIFVEVALCGGIAGSIQELLAENREILSDEEMDTAVFYSISNCQEGLRGISFGSSLIKQVVGELRRELPRIARFVTLSPIPGLMRHLRWLEDDGAAQDLRDAATRGDLAAIENRADELRLLAARWLAETRRPDGTPADPVARFHLGNGAELNRIHVLADISPNGLRQSATAMVNYLYDPARVEANHEAYASRNQIALSRDIRALLSTHPQAEPKKP